jgi:nucleoside-diphosphate-sugar epimerase
LRSDDRCESRETEPAIRRQAGPRPSKPKTRAGSNPKPGPRRVRNQAPRRREQPSILVTGAAGFFGLAIVRSLARAGFRVLASDRVDTLETRPGTPNALVEYVRRDLERDGLGDLVATASTIVYAAALTPPDEAADDVADRLLSVNLIAFLDALRSARRTPRTRRLLFISSSAVYDQRVNGAVHEEDAGDVSSLYAAAKVAAEQTAAAYARLFGLEYCALRPTSLIGPGEIERQSRPRITPFAVLLRAALAGESVRLRRPGAHGDWLSVDDAANAVVGLCRASKLPATAYTVSAGVTVPLIELARAIERGAGLRLDNDAELVVDGGEDLPAVVSHARLAHDVGWTPQRTLDDTVRETLAELGKGPVNGAP